MPNVNIALNLFGIIVMLILFFSCLGERLKRESSSNSFLFMTCSIVCALTADTFAWIAEGRLGFSLMSVIANTASFCACYAVIFFFLLYMSENLLQKGKKRTALLAVFLLLCVLSMILVTAQAFLGISYKINAHGHYVYEKTPAVLLVRFAYPLLTLAVATVILFAVKKLSPFTRVIYLIYMLVPILGSLLDSLIHGLSLADVGMAVSVLIIYTQIYLHKRTVIAEQKNALLTSQINPHFTYNTLSAIASLCDIDPKQAKAMTLDFSSFLRNNLENLASTEPITFEQELRHIDCYLKIEKARFGRKLNVEYRILTDNFLLPALTIQPLVENAVRYGVTKKAGGGTVLITAYQNKRTYVVEIYDDGVGFDPDETPADGRRHLGIANVRERLQSMCGGTLKVHSVKNEGTCVTVEIPKR